jgi:hypothetical protein
MPSPERRPMSVALKTAENLPPEALAFIREGTPKPQVEKPVVAVAAVDNGASRLEERRDAPGPGMAEAPRAVRAKAHVAKEEEPAVVGVVGLTFRLPVQIHHALMRAAFERKFRRERPWTQQEIAAEALTIWLKKSGYLV